MSKQKYTNILKKNWRTIFLFALLGLLLALVFSVVQPLKYSSTIRLLITQQVSSADAYTASRSAERVAEELAAIVYTSTFFDEVVASDEFGIDTSFFSEDEYKKRKEWGKTVEVTVARGTGMLTIKVYNEDVSQAKKISEAISFLLTTEGWTYTSGGNIIVREVDEALLSRWPVKPNIPLNAFSGLVVGLIVGLGYVVVRSELV